MNKRNRILLLYSILAFQLTSRAVAQQQVYTTDIDHFWRAYDSCRTTKDSSKQVRFIQTWYIDRGTPGLKAFMEARDYSAPLYAALINKYPKFWTSIRPATLTAKSKASEIEKAIVRLKTLYPVLKPARIYFTIGGLRSGGTTTSDMVLIGTEVATGTAATDVSEFPDKWLADVFKASSANHIVSLNVHEYIHTQQQGEAGNLLAQCLSEGSCDFIAELVTGKPLQNNYISYGKAHEAALKQSFQQEMFTTAYSRWLYNGSKAKDVADLGYFMGYAICKSYYNQSKDKQQAVKTIIQLNYSDTAAVEAFLEKSGYYTAPFDKQQLVQSYRQRQPVLLQTEPIANGDTLVDPATKQLVLVFSRPMGEGFSINLGERGRSFFPLAGAAGFSEDKTKFTLNLNLQPNHEYEFIVTDRSFASAAGYPLLKSYTVKFKTR